jgi:DNA repair exonuclease SbcCD ATPase subunit
MIVFEKIKWKNFLSTGNAPIEINLSENKTNLIIGTNGAGKSTILDALTFVLFNKPFRKINKPNLINSVNNSDCLVEIHFKIGKRSYKVVRGIKPSVFEIWVDGKMMDQDSETSEQQKYLEQNILRLNFKSFTQIVVLGSSTFVPFMQLTAANRRDIIEDLLDIKIFSTMNSILKDNQKSILDEIRTQEHAIELLKQKSESQQKLIKEITELSDKSIQQKVDKIDELKIISENIQKDIDLLKEELDITNKLLEDIKDPEKQLKTLEGYKSNFVSQLKKYSQLKEFFDNNDSCPTCGQHIEDSFKSEKINKDEEKVKEITAALLKLEEKLDQVQNELNKKQQILRTGTDLFSTIQMKTYELNKNNSYIETIQKEIEDVKNNNNNIAKENLILADIVKKGMEVSASWKQLKKKKQEYEIISYLLKDTGIKSKIIKKYLPIFNQLINKYLQAMDFYVNFTLDENFNETIKSRYRDEFSYASFSEGEKMRIDLALLFTWREIAKIKNSINTNLLILDEVFDSSLDNAGTDDFLRIVRGVDNNTNVFIISHKGDILIDKFNVTYSFEKIKNFSKMSKVD